MKTEEQKKGLYKFLYTLFWGIALTFFIMFLILFILYYFTKQRSVVTFSHLFSLAFLLGVSGISTMLGNHFHTITVMLQKQMVKKPTVKRKIRKVTEDRTRGNKR